MGEVYRARDSRLGRSVAIKVIAPDVAQDATRVARFEREARLSSSLNHINIVTIHDFAQSDGLAYIAMELVDGKSLRALLDAGPLPVKKAISIAAQIAEGMAAAHEVGVVHRDLKPENVMVTAAGVVKILDFGLARGESHGGQTSTVDLTGAHHVMGTAAYMSPEQATGAATDFRSDQFSFGTILYEMASGTHPFRRGSTLAMLAAIETEEPPPLAEIDTAYPEPFLWIVERCLAKEPGQRYASTHDLARDLARMRDLSGSRLAAGVKKKSPLRAWRLAAITFGVIAAGLAVTLFLRKPAPELPLPTHVALHMPEVRTAANEVVMPFAFFPDGRRIVVSGYGSGFAETSWGLFVRDLKSSTAQPIAGTGNGYAPVLSPDGRQLAFHADGKLKIVSLTGGPPRILCDAGESNVSWGRDGTILFARNGEWGTTIFTINAAGGVPVRLTHLGQGRGTAFHRWPAFLPDGTSFLYLAVDARPGQEQSTRRHVLMAATVKGGVPKEIGPMDSRVVFHDGKLLFVREGTLLAQTFDLETMSLQGDPVPIVEGVYNYNSSGVAAFAISRTGTVVYRRPRTESGLWWFDRGGMQGSELAHVVLGQHPGSISPDGKQYATGVVDTRIGSSDLWVFDFARQTPARLTYGGADDSRPVWSADGRSLFFRSDAADGGGPPDVYRLDLGTDKRHLVFHGPHVDEPSDVSRDGKHLLVERFSESGGMDILAVSLPDGKPSNFVTTPFNDANAKFSPDGKWVAYNSDVSGRTEVYLLRFPERGSPIRVSTASGGIPRWRGDGRELFYLAGRQIMSVEVRNTGAEIEVGAARFLFRSGSPVLDYEVTPDGQRFLMRGREDRSPEVHLVLNALPPAR
jgi:Tol biopolymer transport system component/tRNA A-37 threonylcarbamoyl transferase component Bud32